MIPRRVSRRSRGTFLSARSGGLDAGTQGAPRDLRAGKELPMSQDRTAQTPESDSSPEPQDSPRRLLSAARSHLQWLADQGVAWVPGGSSPRRGLAASPELPGASSSTREPTRGAVSALAPTISPTSTAAPTIASTSTSTLAPTLAPPLDVELPFAKVPSGAPGLAVLRETLGDCKRCRLSSERIQLVFGHGDPEAFLMFIGEAPGRDEDLAGEPFVGAAGALLTKMIGAMGLGRDEVYIANVIKCRPPRNRDPQPDEIASCLPFILTQIQAIAPEVIVTLGRHAAQTLLQTDAPVGRLRGQFQTLDLDGRSIPLMPTYHPAYLLRNAEAKRPVWEDLKQVIALLRSRGLLGS